MAYIRRLALINMVIGYTALAAEKVKNTVRGRVAGGQRRIHTPMGLSYLLLQKYIIVREPGMMPGCFFALMHLFWLYRAFLCKI